MESLLKADVDPMFSVGVREVLGEEGKRYLRRRRESDNTTRLLYPLRLTAATEYQRRRKMFDPSAVPPPPPLPLLESDSLVGTLWHFIRHFVWA